MTPWYDVPLCDGCASPHVAMFIVLILAMLPLGFGLLYFLVEVVGRPRRRKKKVTR